MLCRFVGQEVGLHVPVVPAVVLARLPPAVDDVEPGGDAERTAVLRVAPEPAPPRPAAVHRVVVLQQNTVRPPQPASSKLTSSSSSSRA